MKEKCKEIFIELLSIIWFIKWFILMEYYRATSITFLKTARFLCWHRVGKPLRWLLMTCVIDNWKGKRDVIIDILDKYVKYGSDGDKDEDEYFIGKYEKQLYTAEEQIKFGLSALEAGKY